MKCFSITLALIGVFSISALYAESDGEKNLSEAKAKFYDSKSKMESDYRADLAKAIGKADRIEVYLLDFEMEDMPTAFTFLDKPQDGERFPILPYDKNSKVLKKATLTAEQKLEFIPNLQKVVGVQGKIDGGAFCHFPIHGVRVFSGDAIVFESSFCWECNNFAVSYPDGAAWVAIRGTELSAAFSKIMPIPQAEIHRFNKKYGSDAEPSINDDEGDTD